MINTIVCGWDNERGDGKAVELAGLNSTPAQQADIIDAAKRLHQYPKGIKRIVQFKVEAIQTAIFIGTNIGEKIAADVAKSEADAAEKAAKAEKSAKAQAKVVELKAAVQTTAKKRNELMGKLNNVQTEYRNLELTPEALRDQGVYQKSVDRLKLLLNGDKKEKIEGLEAQVKAATEDYEKAAAELAKLHKPDEKQTGNIITGINQ